MMSQRIAWTVTRPAPFGSWTDITFFVIFVPNVAMYRSSYSSSTDRRMRDVFPTVASPAMQSFNRIGAGPLTVRRPPRGPRRSAPPRPPPNIGPRDDETQRTASLIRVPLFVVATPLSALVLPGFHHVRGKFYMAISSTTIPTIPSREGFLAG